MSGERIVHAECLNFEVVRYAHLGWRIESKVATRPTEYVDVFTAAHRALSAESLGGRIYTGTPGGRTFDSKVRIIRARHNLPVPA